MAFEPKMLLQLIEPKMLLQMIDAQIIYVIWAKN